MGFQWNSTGVMFWRAQIWRIVLSLGLGALSPAARGQCVTTTDVSGGLAGTAPGWSVDLIYDADGARCVAIDQSVANSDFVAISAYDGVSWIPLAQTGAIPAGPRYGGVWIYDSARHVGLLFSGALNCVNCVKTNTLYALSGSNWQQLTWTGASPPESYGAFGAFDPNRGRAIFLTAGPTTPLNHLETWEWTGTAWEQGPTFGPVRIGQFVFDARRNRGFLYGNTSDDFEDVWYYIPGPTAAQGVWQQQTITGTPYEAVIGANLVYDPIRARTLRCFGRYASNIYSYLPTIEVWNWDTSTFDRLDYSDDLPFGARRGPCGVAYDINRDTLVVFGGARVDQGVFTEYQDTWEQTREDPGVLVDLDFSQTWCAEQNAALAIATAGAATVQWYKDNQPIPGATGSVLPFSPVLATGGGVYKALAYNACGGSFSRECVVTVRLPPTISAEPIWSATECPGNDAVILGPIVHGEEPIEVKLQRQIGEFWADVPGQVGVSDDVFTLTNVQNGDTGFYRFACTNVCSTTLSQQFHIQVGVTFTAAPQPLAPAPCDPVILEVGADGVGSLSYQWRRSGQPLVDDARIVGAHTSVLSINGVHYEDEGQYDCLVTDSCETRASTAATLTIPGAPGWAFRAMSGPLRRSYLTDMAYDPVRSVCVLYGGEGVVNPNGNTDYLNDTWEWDGLAWTQRFPAHNPGKRRGHKLVFDPTRNAVLLFGGFSPQIGASVEVWMYDGVDWTLLVGNAGGPPLSTFYGDAAVDSARNKLVILYDPTGAGGTNARTWELDLATLQWQEVSAGPGPSTFFSSLAFDPLRALTVSQYYNLVNGTNSTWTWAGAGWLTLLSGVTPQRYNPNMAYDATRRRVTLVGCCRDLGQTVNQTDTWAFEGAWQMILPNFHTDVFTALKPFVMAYDSRRRAMVLAGSSYNDQSEYVSMQTWEYRYLDRVVIDRPPSGATIVPGQTVQFDVIASGAPPLAYQWRRNGVPLVNGPTGTGSTISGVATPTLQIADATSADAAQYSCLVANPCDQAIAAAALSPPFCPGNANGDNIVDFDDINAVIANWLTNYSPGTGPGDADGDGVVDFNDINAVIANWLSICPKRHARAPRPAHPVGHTPRTTDSCPQPSSSGYGSRGALPGRPFGGIVRLPDPAHTY